MTSHTAHVDSFARDHLPPREQWPLLTFGRPELQYPARLNCARVLLDDAIEEGHGSRIVVYADQEAWSWNQLRDRVDRIAHVLVREMGVVPGNRVLLRAPNCPMLMAAWLAVMKTGAIAVTTMPLLRSRELSVIAGKARIDHALCDHRLADELLLAAAASGSLRHCVTFGDGDLEGRLPSQPDGFDAVDTSAEDVCMLAFTSGTTGSAKATMHFHRDVLATTDVVARHLLRTQQDDVYLGSPPLGFTFGLGALLLFPLRFRAASVMLERPTAASLLSCVQRFRATCLFTAPTMYRGLVAAVRDYDLSSLRRCVSAGEPLAKSTFDAWLLATGLRLIDGIGATEMLHIFIGAAGDDIRPGATGRPLPGYDACVLDEHNQPRSSGHSGRLAVRGPTGCRYLADVRQKDYVIDGWNVTGDYYRIDAEGYFWFVARSDDMIVSAGYNIGGPEVEGALLDHPAVREVAVIGAPDPERGHIVKAFVVLQEPFAAGPALVGELQDFVKTVLAPYKYPRAIEFVEQLPKTPTGKVQRFMLRQRELDAAARKDV